MWVKRSRNFFKFAPEDGAGGGLPGPITVAPAPSATAPVSTPAPTPTAPESDPDIAGFRSELKEGADRMRQRMHPQEDKANQVPAVNPNLLHDAKPADPMDAPGPTSTQAEPEKPATDPAAPAPEPAKADLAEKFTVSGIEMDRQTIEKHVAFAKDAQEFFNTQGKAMIDRENAVAQKEAQFKEMFESNPDVKILENLKKYPALRDKYFEVAADLMPHLQGEHAAATADVELKQELATLKAELKQLREGVVGDKTRQQQEYQRREQAREQAEIRTVVDGSHQYLNGKAKEFGIPPSIVRSIVHDASALVEAGKLEFSIPSIQKHFDSVLAEITGFRKAGEASATKNYLDGKRNNPPPPPTGGGTARVLPDRAKSFAEATNRFMNRLKVLESS